ncbi:hypothetical protein AAVH_33126 [Aphelenchoides avenae]|nr:hypothetical protein AAVH_33126 [Aphelenchus avenae]
MPYVPVSASGSASVFRLEAQVVGRGHAPARNRCYELEYLRNGEKWLMNLWHYTDNDYALVVRAPGTVKAFTYTQYQRTNNSDIQFRNNYLDLGR